MMPYCADIGNKARAIADLVRIDLVFGAGLFTVAGQIFALGKIPPADLAALGFLAVSFIACAANSSNDYFDLEVDRVNRPSRPLPSGKISASELWTLFFFCTAAGLAAAALLGPYVLALAALVWGLSLLYNIKLKETGIFGNIIVASCVSMTFIIGGVSTGLINGVVLTFGVLAFLFDLGEEIAADAMDISGDAMRSSDSLAKKRGIPYALRVSAAVFTVFIALTALPFLAGWFGYAYLILIGVTDLCMAYFVYRLVTSRTTDEGHVQIKSLYLTWGLFVFAFIVTILI